ncbi:MAG TPA: prenyltransferase/squalene oxidase repeat-containing protein [Gemmataceae bacterium]|nr:prenyltransferase/squalene oxidase repeat-containing protein [Gemmataceae bacterium]
MRSTPTRLVVPIMLAMLAWPTGALGQRLSVAPKPPENPYPYTPEEPNAGRFSLWQSATYLDGVAQFWMQPNSCGACHANFAYLIARPHAGGDPAPLLAQTRQFLEARKAPNPKAFSFDSEAVAIAFALARDDARTGGQLRPATRQALSRMWALQKSSGRWSPIGCGEVIPPETDRYYTVILAALAAGFAPEGYAREPAVQDGLTRLRRFFATTPPAHLHDEALLLWASLHLDGLMTAPEREATVRSLLGRQGRDGGWSFHDLISTAPSRQASDGYGTGLAIYVLRQAGVPASRPEIARGVGWLRANQRVSGRWFTPAPVSQTEGGVGSRDLYAQNLGTAFAVLALTACDATESGPARPRLPRGASGLALREYLIPGG